MKIPTFTRTTSPYQGICAIFPAVILTLSPQSRFQNEEKSHRISIMQMFSYCCKNLSRKNDVTISILFAVRLHRPEEQCSFVQLRNVSRNLFDFCCLFSFFYTQGIRLAGMLSWRSSWQIKTQSVLHMLHGDR